MKPVDNTTFIIGSFNVTGIAKTEKQQLAKVIDPYNLDVCCLQETKIKDGLDVDIGVKRHKLVSLQSVSPHYGSGFVINKRWKRSIHRYWKVSEFRSYNSTPTRKNINVYQMRTVSTSNCKSRNLIHVIPQQLATQESRFVA